MDEPRAHPAVQWRETAILLVALLLLEGAWLLSSTVVYQIFRQALVLRWGRMAFGFGLYFAVALVTGAFQRVKATEFEPQHRKRVFAVHLGYFFSLPWLLAALWQVDPFSRSSTVELLPWMAILLGLFLTWCACLASFRTWLRFLQNTWLLIPGGVLTSLLAYGLGGVMTPVWDHMAGVTLTLVVGLLHLLGMPVRGSTSTLVIDTSIFQAHLLPLCSGVEGMALVAIFVTAYLWLGRHRLRFPHALLLLPVGICIIWITNILRIAMFLLIGTYWSSFIALACFHSNVGWLMFAAVSFSIIWLTEKGGWFSSPASPGGLETSTEYPPAPYLVPMLTLMAAMLACNAFALGFDDTYPLRMLALLFALGAYWRRYRSWRFSFSWMAVAVGVGVFGVWLILEPASRTTGDNPFLVLPPDIAVGWVAVRLLGSSLLVPLAEELAFKGFLLRRLISPQFESVRYSQFTLASFLISSLAFAVLHQRWFAAAVAGSIYTLVLYRRGNLWDAVQAHAATNFCLGAWVIWSGHWAMWN
ncbi:MAG TPA: exosortase E/protease, VPEID-CTERM system [Candidatus Xenobia bacterium]